MMFEILCLLAGDGGAEEWRLILADRIESPLRAHAPDAGGWYAHDPFETWSEWMTDIERWSETPRGAAVQPLGAISCSP